MSLAVHITIEPQHGRPVSLARINDLEVLRGVARAALATARFRVAECRDPVLEMVHRDEVERLRSYFELLVPGFSSSSDSAATSERIC